MQKRNAFGWRPLVVLLVVLATYVVPSLAPGTFVFALLGRLVLALLILGWWFLFSRRSWLERVSALGLMAASIAIVRPLLDVSVATAGQGMLFYIHALPLLAFALFGWALLMRRLDGLAGWARFASMVATFVIAGGVWTLVRTGGITGDGESQFAWRWSKTPEERLLARASQEPSVPLAPPPDAPPVAAGTEESNESEMEATPPNEEMVSEDVVPDTVASSELAPSPVVPAAPSWPGFRGPRRDGIVAGVRIETDWTKTPPNEVWRRPIGPGWSSFAVDGNLLYTQEQRGDEEIVACYDATTGEPVWKHSDPVRFYESNGGAGPRGTPTVDRGRLYSFGATGILNVLDAVEGTVLWSRDVAADCEAKVPGWGFASSPLVVGDVVVVAAAGRLVGYDLRGGEPRWLGPKGGGGYSSPQLATVDGVEQVLLLNGAGLVSVAPRDGELLWEYAWDGFRIVQPAVIADGDLLISTADAAGGISTRRITVKHESSGWNVEERWTSRGLKPYFNDLVVHEGHAYGFDGSILSCIDLEDGEREWKGGRFGHGQLVLLPDEDLLLVLSEEGELALVSATPERFQELARFPALEGKTWNHPVLVHDTLFVRNGEEMAAFHLSPANDRSTSLGAQ